MRKPKAKAPSSYINRQRPPLADAMKAEGNISAEEAVASLMGKGYFTARPRPWCLGRRDRGLIRGDFAVLDRFGDIIAEVPERADAYLIIRAVNAYKP